MTDTARTVADLKSRLPDNTDGEILPQIARDIVESIANPIGGGGLASPRSEVCFLGSSPVTTHALQWTPFDSVEADTEEIVVPQSYVSAYSGGNTVPANSSVELSNGLWFWTAFFAWSGGNPGSGNVTILADWTEYPTDDPIFGGNVGLYSMSQQEFNWSALAFHSLKVNGWVRVTDDFDATGRRFGIECSTSASETLTYRAWALVKV